MKTIVKTLAPSQLDKTSAGTVQFLLWRETTDGHQHLTNSHQVKGNDNGLEYLCVEDSVLDQSRDTVAMSNTCHVWCYDDLLDSLSMWSVGRDDPMQAHSLSHMIDFKQPKDEEEREDGWLAHTSHLSTAELDVSYKFAFQAVNLMEWSITRFFKVDGKDFMVHKVMTC